MSVRLYIRHLPPGLPKREAERIAARELAGEAGVGEIHHTDTGAPIVRMPGVYISISHNRDTCILAVSDTPVGVDIETPRPTLAKTITRVSSTDESGIDPLHLWTAKEAVFKCAGIRDMTIPEVTVSPTLRTATARGLIFNLQYQTLGDALVCTAQRYLTLHGKH